MKTKEVIRYNVKGQNNGYVEVQIDSIDDVSVILYPSKLDKCIVVCEHVKLKTALDCLMLSSTLYEPVTSNLNEE